METKWKLIIEDSAEGTRRESPLPSPGTTVIGRKTGDVQLTDPYVSRIHAVLYETAEGDLRLKDMGSANGTYLNGSRIEDEAASWGDEILIGHTVIRLLDFVPNQERS